MTATRRFAIAGLATTLVAAAVMAALIAFGGPGAVPDNWGFRGYWAVTGALFAFPGAAILARRDHVIGRILLAVGTATAICGLLQEYVNYGYVLHPGALPGAVAAAWILSWAWLASIAPILMVLVLFPDGRFPSPRWHLFAWSTAGMILLGFAVYAFKPGPLENSTAVPNPFGVTGPVETLRGAGSTALNLSFVLLAIVGGAASVLRFRRAIGEQREQLKWFAYSAAILATAATFLIASGERKVAQIVMICALGALPISVAVAVLRYRLYDIDLIINRTIVYGALSAVLAATYYGSVVLLQSVLTPLTGGSEIAVAIATLAVIALVQPLRRRIQQAIDQRFYRSRYDAAQTVDSFAARLRDEVDIDALRSELAAVINEAVRPTHASVWLREARR